MHVKEMGLALLVHSSMPMKFWDEAFYAQVYIINKPPSYVLNFYSPYELFYKTNSDYLMLKGFGCRCFQYLKPFNSHKFDFKIDSCTFLSYSPIHKGHKCLTIKGKVLISRNIMFDEHWFPFSICPNTSTPTDLLKVQAITKAILPLLSKVPIVGL